MASSTFAQEIPLLDAAKSAVTHAGKYLTEPVRLFRTYDPSNFRPDLMAGLTVAVILLPQAIAFTIIAELPPQMGLYAAVIGGIVGALWGSSNQSHNGPTNAISLLVLSTLSATVLPGTPEYILAASVLAVMVGIVQLILGLARLGVLVNFVSYSVIVGFASGAGVLIFLKEIGPMLGLSSRGANIMEATLGIILAVPSSHVVTAAIGLGTIAFLVILRRISPRLPAELLAMILSSILVYLLGLDQQGVQVIGRLPSGFPPPTDFSSFNFEMLGDLFAGAVAVGAIGLVSTIAIAKSIATQTRQRLDSNQEFVGQGMGNLLTGLFSGYPVAGSFSRSAVNFRAGARTRIAAVLSSIFVLIALQFLGPFTRYLPRSALSGVLIVTAIGMIDRHEIMRILRGGRGDAVIMVVTFLGTLFLNLDAAVLVGILLSFGRYIMRTSSPRVHTVVPDESYRHFSYSPDSKDCPQLGIVEILGDLYFGAVNHVEDFILDLALKNPDQRYLLIRMHRVNTADFSGIHMLESVVDSYRARGGDVFLVRVSYSVMQRMIDTEFDKYLGESNFLEEDSAISKLFYRVLDPAMCIYECPIRVFKECQNLPKRLDIIDLSLSKDHTTADFSTVKARDLWTTLREGDRIQLPMLVDVREPREFHKGHINGAHSIPLPAIPAYESDLAKDHPIVLICRSSRRSRQAAAILWDKGYTNITVLEGGMLAWESAGLLEAIDTYQLPDRV